MSGVADRRNKTMRDMALSMGLLVVVVLAFVFFNGQASFSPGGPSGGAVPSANVQSGFAEAKADTGFTALMPQGLPANWSPNSFSTTGLHDAGGVSPTARGGWITPDGRFITLIQSTGTIPQVQQAELGATAAVTGSIDAGGASWKVTSGRRGEQAWMRTDGALTLLITGDAPVSDFQTLAQSIAGQ
jgi:hypothetical protein